MRSKIFALELNIKNQDETVMFEVLTRDLLQKLNELVASYQSCNTERNENNRELLKFLLKTNTLDELKNNINGRFGDLSRINENFIESMVKMLINISNVMLKCIDSSEKCIDFLKFIKNSKESNNQEIVETNREPTLLERCSLCTYTCSNSQSLERHFLIKHQIKKQSLSTILKKTDTKRVIPTSMIKTYLNQEYTIVPNPTKKYACKQCPYKTSHLSDLNRHITRHGPKENAFKCRYCTYYVLQKCNIERHEVIHPEYTPDPNNKSYYLAGNYTRNPITRPRKKAGRKVFDSTIVQATVSQPQSSFQQQQQQQQLQNHQIPRQENIVNSQTNFRVDTQTVCGQQLLTNFLQQEQPTFNDINRYEQSTSYFEPNYVYPPLSNISHQVPLEINTNGTFSNINHPKLITPINISDPDNMLNSENYMNVQVNGFSTQYTVPSVTNQTNHQELIVLSQSNNANPVVANTTVASNNSNINLSTLTHVSLVDEENNETLDTNGDNEDDDDDEDDENQHEKNKKKNKKQEKEQETFTREDKKYMCKLCPYATDHNTNMKKHVKGHEPKEGQFKCRYCNFYLSNGKNVRKHEINHPEYKPISLLQSCSICPFKTTEKSIYRKHMLKHEFKEGLLKCNYCNFYANKPGLIKSHETLHADKEQLEASAVYECQQCPFKTNYASNFKTHMAHHSSEGKDNEEKCRYCDYYASSHALIKKHENTHVKLEDTFEKIRGAKKYACKLCPYKARDITHLSKHILNHNYQEDYFKCRYCDYYSNELALIAKHETIHIDYAPNPTRHECKKCPYKTNKSSSLKAHELKHGFKDGWFKCKFCDFHVQKVGYLELHEILHATN